MQIVDCSVALYQKLQQYTICSDPSKPNSGPFCTNYHLGFATQDEQRSASATTITQKQVRSSLYFFLPNTMIEFPFAWWHKCVLLQVRVENSHMHTSHTYPLPTNEKTKQSVAKLSTCVTHIHC